jgi:hypothetical protein
MKGPAAGIRFALALAFAAGAAGGCERKREAHPPKAAKPISPPAVEPLPAPRARGQLPSPAGTPTPSVEPTAADAGIGR